MSKIFNDANTFQIMLNTLPNSIYLKDKEGKYLWLNTASIKQLEYKHLIVESIIGKTDLEIFPEANASEYVKNDKKVLELKSGIVTEEVVDIPNSKKLTQLSFKEPLYDESSEIVGILGYTIDITDRKNMEEALRHANQAKSDFLANMSHDIRTPITGMVGMIYNMQLVCDQFKALQHSNPELFKNPNPAIAKMVETIDSIAQDSDVLMGVTDELLQFFNEVLEVIRLESGQLDYKVSSFNLYDVVEHNCELLQSVARHKNIVLKFNIDANVPTFITGFRMYLDRVILNLVSNALKFTSTGSVEILVSLKDQKNKKVSVGDSVTLECKVKDTGIGIPKDKFDVIFEHFSRLTPSYNGLYKGAGMGLYTVKQYVEAMNGDIKLESDVGIGSCFIVTVPFVVADHSDHVEKAKQSIRPLKPAILAQNSETKALNAASLQNCKAAILIVEDTPMAAKVLATILKGLHCSSDIADTGAKAVEMAEKNSYDLILMDIGLPDFDGIEVTKRIRALSDPKKSHVPIIAVTGHGDDPGMRAKALDAGMQEVMSKPANPALLASHLEYFVFKAKQQEKIIDWENMFVKYPDNQDFVKEMIGMFVVEVNTMKPIITQSFADRDVIELRKALHRIRGAVSYLSLPELEKSLEAFHKSVHENWENQNLLQNKYDALIKAMDVFVKVASQL